MRPEKPAPKQLPQLTTRQLIGRMTLFSIGFYTVFKVVFYFGDQLPL